MQEIVGIQIKGTIYTGIEALRAAKLHKSWERLITKDIAKFMQSCDLGRNWEMLGQAPILFIIKDDNTYDVPADTLLGAHIPNKQKTDFIKDKKILE
jgi:hypothetical protein